MANLYQANVLASYGKIHTLDGQKLTTSHSWLEEVLEPPVAAEIERVIDGMRNKEPEYEPLLFDVYLPESSAALDRCLALRREIQEIESRAITYARDYERFSRTLTVDQKLGDRTRLIEQSKLLKDGFQKAGEALKANGASELSAGLKKQFETLSLSNDAAATDLEERDKLEKERWKILKTMKEEEESDHRKVGHALNFSERRQRLLDLLRRDLTEAYKKLIAVAEGLRTIYGNDEFSRKLPAASDKNVLDSLVQWARDAIDFIERQREREVEFDLVIPLVQKSVDRENGSISVGATADPFKMGQSGVFTVNTTEWFNKLFGEVNGKKRLRALRLSAIGASVSTNLNQDNDVRSAIWTLVVFPPATPRALDQSMTEWQSRPPIILGDVRATSYDRNIAMESGLDVHNQKIVGEWRVRVMPHVATGTVNAKSREFGATDLKLHLRVVGVPLNDIAGW